MERVLLSIGQGTPWHKKGSAGGNSV